MSTWGIIPAVGPDPEFHPLACSKELLPMGARVGEGVVRPRVLGEYIVERMIAGGATKICFVISPGKSDIVEYFGGRIGDVDLAYVVQPRPAGWCDALFRARPVVGEGEHVLIGQPDKVWFPEDGFALMPDHALSFLLFPAVEPHLSEVVVTDADDRVLEIQVRPEQPRSSWIWGAAKMDGAAFHALHALWRQPGRKDEFLGTLVNAHLALGGDATGVPAGLTYLDVGTLQGYRDALQVLDRRAASAEGAPAADRSAYTDGWRPLTAATYAHAFPHQRVEVDALHRSNR